MEVVVVHRCQTILPFKQLQVILVKISKNIQVTYFYLCKTSYESQKIGYGSSSQVKYTSTIDAIRTLKSTARPMKRNGTHQVLAYYAIPLFVIAAFYVLMARRLVLSTRTLPGKHNRQKGQSNQIQFIDSYYQLYLVTAEQDKMF